MTSRPWAVLRDAGIVYGLTFAAGVGMASIGVTLQSSPWTAYLANLLPGARVFLASGIRVNSDRVEHLAWVAATLWTCNLLNVALRLQSTASWIHSGITVILMVALGGTLSMMLTPPAPFHRHKRVDGLHKPPVR